MNRLTGIPYHSMSRYMDMLCLNLGKEIIVYRLDKERNYSPRIYPEFSLHLQTPWRFSQNGTILLGSRDIYEPFSPDDVDECWQYDIPGRPDNESNVFDVKKKQLDELLTNTHIAHAVASPLGDIRLDFSNGIIFEAFIPDSYPDEEWRLIDFAQDEHVIFHDI